MDDVLNQLKLSLKTVDPKLYSQHFNSANAENNIVSYSKSDFSIPNLLFSSFFKSFYWPKNRCIRFQQHLKLKTPFKYKQECIKTYIYILGLCSLLQLPTFNNRYNVFKNDKEEIFIIDSEEIHLIECYLFAISNNIQSFTLIDPYTLSNKQQTIPLFVRHLYSEQNKIENLDNQFFLFPMTHSLVDTSYCKYCCYVCK